MCKLWVGASSLAAPSRTPRGRQKGAEAEKKNGNRPENTHDYSQDIPELKMTPVLDEAACVFDDDAHHDAIA
jgi:hypothetical protein